MDPTALLGLIAAGFGGLWLYFRNTNEARINDLRTSFDERLKDRDQQIADLKTEIDERDQKIETLNNALAKNSDALDQVAGTQEKVAALLADLLGPTSAPPSRGPTR